MKKDTNQQKPAPILKGVDKKLDALRTQIAISQKKGVRDSYMWYTNQIKKLSLSTVQPMSIANSSIGEYRGGVRWGDMYLFMYDPKLKATLPFYDMFPLVLPFDILKNGFLGLNLHYLPPILREKLFNQLLRYTNDNSITESTRFRLSWELLSNTVRFPEVKPCIKQYLGNHIRTSLLKINPTDWKMATMLPIETFMKADKRTVWNDSISKIS